MRLRLTLFAAILLAAAVAYPRSRAVKPPASSNIEAVWFGEYYPVEVRPGAQRQFALSEDLGGGPFNSRPVTGIDIRWTVEPRMWWATVDQSGLLTVDPATSSGTTLQLYANLNHGERIISLPVYVHIPGNDPFLDGGVWAQSAEIPCDGSPDVPVSNGISELRFTVSGVYMATWQPFEVYTDFWGPYTFNPARKRVTFGVSGGNYVPDDLKGEGDYEIVFLGPPVPDSWGTHMRPAQLRLKNLYLGTANRAPHRAAIPCGMVFVGTVETP